MTTWPATARTSTCRPNCAATTCSSASGTDSTTIPNGETITYGELAAELADGSTAQEVGAAVGRNPLSIVVPCHRVVGKNGKLTGYAGGLERKKFLLELEEPAELREARLF